MEHLHYYCWTCKYDWIIKKDLFDLIYNSEGSDEDAS